MGNSQENFKIESLMNVSPLIPMKVHRKSMDLEKGNSRCVSAIDVLRLGDVWMSMKSAIREYGLCIVNSTYW